jgi:hypothetical protein
MTITEKFPRLQSETVRYAVPVCAVMITTAGCLFSKEVVNFPISFRLWLRLPPLLFSGSGLPWWHWSSPCC